MQGKIKPAHFRKPPKERQRININLIVQQEQEEMISVMKETEKEDVFLLKVTTIHLPGAYLAGLPMEQVNQQKKIHRNSAPSLSHSWAPNSSEAKAAGFRGWLQASPKRILMKHR